MKNPVRKIKEDNYLTSEELGLIADVSQSTIYQHMSGGAGSVNAKVLKACQELGYDPEEVERRYQEFRKAKKMELLQKNKK